MVCHLSVTDGDKLSLLDLHLSNRSGACKEVSVECNDKWSDLEVTVHFGHGTPQLNDCLDDPYCVTDTMTYSDIVESAGKRRNEMFFPSMIYGINHKLEMFLCQIRFRIQ